MIALSSGSDQSAIPNPQSAIKISCLILTYNEEHRIRTALTHALKWADEVIVLDKGSTDSTAALARGAGARVHQIPFSRQGHERYEDMVAPATHDWVWHFTPGEVPTPACIAKGRGMIGDHADLILVPMHYYSFGVHHPASPWAGGWQARLYNRRRVTFTGVAHDPIRSDRQPWVMPRDGDCYVLHQTHSTAEAFIRSHADYAINEAQKDAPDRVLAQAIHQMQVHHRIFSSTPELQGQHIGWQLYWLMVALHAWSRMNPRIPADYHARAAESLKDWDSQPSALN